MTGFVQLQSVEGREALARSLESPAVRSVAAGKLDVQSITGMVDDDVRAAFQLIRWPDSQGEATCPRCHNIGAYWYSKKQVWSCKACHSQFTATSGTVLASRKMPLRNYLFGLAVVLKGVNWGTATRLQEATGCNYRTAWDLARKFRAGVAEGDKGLTLKRGLMSRASWLVARNNFRARFGRMMPPHASVLRYPYLREDSKSLDGADLLIFVNSLVPKHLPDYVRSDICQDLAVAVLSGECTAEQLKGEVRGYISRVLADSPWKYKWISFDAPLGDGDGRTLHDLIAAPDETDWAA